MFIWLLCIVISGCNILWDKPPPTLEDQVIVDKAAERINTYIRQKRSSCLEDIIEEAEVHVDTTITRLIDQYIKDTTYFPPRPLRPERPDALVPDTNFKPVPIFKDSLKTRIRLKRDTLIQVADTILMKNDSIGIGIDTSKM